MDGAGVWDACARCLRQPRTPRFAHDLRPRVLLAGRHGHALVTTSRNSHAHGVRWKQ